MNELLNDPVASTPTTPAPEMTEMPSALIYDDPSFQTPSLTPDPQGPDPHRTDDPERDTVRIEWVRASALAQRATSRVLASAIDHRFVTQIREQTHTVNLNEKLAQAWAARKASLGTPDTRHFDDLLVTRDSAQR